MAAARGYVWNGRMGMKLEVARWLQLGECPHSVVCVGNVNLPLLLGGLVVENLQLVLELIRYWLPAPEAFLLLPNSI